MVNRKCLKEAKMLLQEGQKMKKIHFWHDFASVVKGFDINTFLNRKYLAYFALLAGWIWFCYWLFAHGIRPVFATDKPDNYPVRIDSLRIPLAFTWGSDTPLAGQGFDAWRQQIQDLDSAGAIVIWKSYYFKDEAATTDQQIDLGRRRIKRVLSFLNLDRKRLLFQILPQEIYADVKSIPFSAIAFDQYQESDILSFFGDTAQVCFPIADSLLLPAISLEKLDQWEQDEAAKNKVDLYLIGTADGTGIAESAEVAVDRAEWIKDRWVKTGWKEESIHLSSGQRNNPHTLQNRCVVVYFENDAKQ